VDIVVRRLDATEALTAVGDLAEVLFDCVDGGASIGFMAPFTREDAASFFAVILPEVERGMRALLAAYDEEGLVGTVQIAYPWQPNQPHRGDITKLLVHRRGRGRGVGQALMERAEAEAHADGRTLLVLDAVTDGDAFRLYKRLGWVAVGEIPDFALYPDGRYCPTTFFFKRI
jgi:ribosomal protein S18 acetylase RimI-like enzyme